MSRLIRFFTKILDICKLVPMLPVVVIAAIPLALLGDCDSGTRQSGFRPVAGYRTGAGYCD